MRKEIKNRLIGAYYDVEYVLDYLLGEDYFSQDGIDTHASGLAGALEVLRHYF